MRSFDKGTVSQAGQRGKLAKLSDFKLPDPKKKKLFSMRNFDTAVLKDARNSEVVAAHKNTLARRNTLGYLKGHSMQTLLSPDASLLKPVSKSQPEVLLQSMFDVPAPSLRDDSLLLRGSQQVWAPFSSLSSRFFSV